MAANSKRHARLITSSSDRFLQPIEDCSALHKSIFDKLNIFFCSLYLFFDAHHSTGTCGDWSILLRWLLTGLLYLIPFPAYTPHTRLRTATKPPTTDDQRDHQSFTSKTWPSPPSTDQRNLSSGAYRRFIRHAAAQRRRDVEVRQSPNSSMAGSNPLSQQSEGVWGDSVSWTGHITMAGDQRLDEGPI